MDYLADRLKARRKEYGLSQADLAEGICEQSQISKIEKGNYMPAANLLYQLAVKLDVPMEYFFNEKIESISNLSEFHRLSSKLLNDNNYKDLEYLYYLEEEKHAFLSKDDKAFMTWIYAIILFYNHNESDQAISILKDSLHSVSNSQNIHLRMLNTLANFYSLLHRDEEYEEIYRKLLLIYSNKDFDSQEILFGYIRVQYNYAYYLQDKNQKLEAMRIAMETIDICKAHEVNYQLDRLFIIIANASQEFSEKEKAIEYYRKALELSNLYDKHLLSLQIEKHIHDVTTQDSLS